MTEIHSNDRLDERVIAEMRSAYAAPGDPEYWASLESRIVARTRMGNGVNGWISVLGHWAMPGLTAAALLVAVAGALWSRLDQAELRTTYEEFTQPMVADAMPGAAQLLDLPRDVGARREATLTYVLSH